VCGLECDGPSSQAAPSARDRDRLRQQVLEARGWRLHRIWSTDWYKDRAGQVERILALVAAARDEALAQAEAAAAAAAAAEADPAPDNAELVEQGEGGHRMLPQQDDAFDELDDYERPAGAAYRFTPGEGRFAGRDLLAAPASQVQNAAARVVAAEAPVHVDDVVARVAGMWSVRVGSRIRARVLEALQAAAAEGRVVVRGEFAWKPDHAWEADAERAGGGLSVRSRAGTRIPPERVAPEEIRAAVLHVLGTGHGFPRPALINEVRALLGYGRATEALARAVEAQVRALLEEGVVGEGSAGLTLRGA
jgi:hypothetical protein